MTVLFPELEERFKKYFDSFIKNKFMHEHRKAEVILNEKKATDSQCHVFNL